MDFSAPHNSQAVQLQLLSRATLCGQQGACASSRATGQPEKYQLESLLWVIYRKHIYRWKAHLAEEHFISQKSLKCTDGESFGEHSGSSSFQYSFVMRFAWDCFPVGQCSHLGALVWLTDNPAGAGWVARLRAWNGHRRDSPSDCH